jgi:hypothetical protein
MFTLMVEKVLPDYDHYLAIYTFSKFAITTLTSKGLE